MSADQQSYTITTPESTHQHHHGPPTHPVSMQQQQHMNAAAAASVSSLPPAVAAAGGVPSGMAASTFQPVYAHPPTMAQQPHPPPPAQQQQQQPIHHPHPQMMVSSLHQAPPPPQPPQQAHHQPPSVLHHHHPQQQLHPQQPPPQPQQSHQHVVQQQPPPQPPPPQPPQQAPTQNTGGAGGAKKPVEFNHAINYVNKIKNRFAREPEVYNQFLEILRVYKNESKPIAEVYAQVQILFKNSPDLLDEFKQFLPDPNANNNAAAAASGGRAAPAAGIPPTASAVSYAQQQHQQQMMGGYGKRNSISMQAAQRGGVVSKRPGLVASAAVGPMLKKNRIEERRFALQHGAAEEFEFFEKVKKALGNKTTYSEFLKILNLFNQDIIDPKVLVEKVEPFLSRFPDLLGWFKTYVRYEESDDQVGVIMPAPAPPRDLTGAKRSGSSYRLLPKDYVQPASSGRDALSQEVLNDEWVCHPTWASEDGGFVAHRKNQFEEALYRCEEERYEFDRCIEANKSVIQRLEPIAKRIAEMSSEEQRAFKLPDGLGDGYSKTIYKLVIKKIYDKERGQEVIECLHEHPAVAVPIILKRLKQKDEEWRRNQREWNKVWREVDGKNFYKSLDHQGINFKTVDKKAITPKSLINEIETLYREQHERLDSSSREKFQLQYKFMERSLVEDLHRLIAFYIDKVSQYSDADQERVQKFLDRLVKEFMTNPDDPTLDHTKNIFFVNNAFYIFFRLYQLMYSRLKRMREASENVGNNPVGFGRQNASSIAQTLDLVRRDTLPIEIADGNVYQALLGLIEKLFEGEIDSAVFEEQARFWFGTIAFTIYTVDKVVHHICKQLAQIVTDPRCIKLFSLFLREKSGANEAAYRQKSDEIVDEDENLYKLEYHFNENLLKIELLGEEECENDDDAQIELRWSKYIDKYVKMTEDADLPVYPAFLKRNCRKVMASKSTADIDTVNGLECKICINTYKMFFVENTEDCLYRRMNPPTLDSIRSHTQHSHERFQAWLQTNWSHGLDQSERKQLSHVCEQLFLGKNSSESVAKKMQKSGLSCRHFTTASFQASVE